MDHGWYDSHFDDYGQPNEPGWGPYLSVRQRTLLLEKLATGSMLTPTERFIISSGQLGMDAVTTLGSRPGSATDVQTLPGMTITAALPALGVALVAYLLLSRRE